VSLRNLRCEVRKRQCRCQRRPNALEIRS
jgi:hypothetical protein